MPRRRKPARIYWRKPRPGREGAWVILDGGSEHRTGARSEREAQTALGQYLIEKSAVPDSPRERDALTVGDALSIYAEQHATTTQDPARIGWAIDALAPFWGDLPISAITANTCRRYAKARGRAPATVRRELGVLRAALNHCEREGYLTSAPVVTLPDPPPAKERWLTRDEVAALLRVARADPRSKHIARFILLALYTGTRPGAVLRVQWQPNTAGGHIDLERGVLYRAPAAAQQSKKRQTPARLPRQILAHLHRWAGQGHVITYAGRPVAEIKSRTWQALCQRAGVDHCTPHTLRHTCATWLMQKGADRWDAAGFLGMTVDTLEKVYGHHHPDHQSSAIRALERR